MTETELRQPQTEHRQQEQVQIAQQDRVQKRTQLQRILFTCLPLLFLVASFARYLWLGGANRLLSVITAAALLFLYCLSVIRLIPQWQRAWSGDPLPVPTMGRRSARPSRAHPFFRIALTAAVTRIAIFVAVYLLYCNGSYQGGVFDLLHLWVPADSQAANYLLLAESMYPATGDLFFLLPFYPTAVRLIDYLFQNTLVSGLFLSNLAFVFSAWLVYELTLFDMDRDAALKASSWFCLLPGSLLLMLPTADSIFLLLCLFSMVMTRRHRYLAASLFGFAAAFTRLSGLLLLLPIGMELIGDCIRAYRAGSAMRHRTACFIGRFASLLLIPLGTLCFGYICNAVSGNPLAFLRNGNLQFGCFYDAVGMHTAALLSALQSGEFPSVAAHGVQLVHLIVPILVLIAAIPKMRASYSAFFLLYYALAIGTLPTEIPRVIVTAFPLCPMMTAAIKNRMLRALVTLILLVSLAFAVWAYAAQWPIF